jgi:nicotinamidase-related amidase
MTKDSEPQGAPARIENMKAALLIIDVQRGFFEADPAPADAEAVIGRINQLAARARSRGAPVFILQHEAEDPVLVHGSPAWELDGRLRVMPQDIRVRKTTPDSFLRTPLHDLLSQRGVDEVVLCGYASEFCIDTTARRAASLGFAVTIAGDAHTTNDRPRMSAAAIRDHHNEILPEISSFGPAIRAAPSGTLWA